MVPKTCKDLFWKASKIFHHYFTSSDEYTSPSKIFGDINAVIHAQIDVIQYQS